MRLTLTRYGGIAGRSGPPVVVDTATVLPEQARRLAALVRAADLSPGSTEIAQDRDSRDTFGYELEVTYDDGQRRSIAFDHRSAPETVRALVGAIRALAAEQS